MEEKTQAKRAEQRGAAKQGGKVDLQIVMTVSGQPGAGNVTIAPGNGGQDTHPVSALATLDQPFKDRLQAMLAKSVYASTSSTNGDARALAEAYAKEMGQQWGVAPDPIPSCWTGTGWRPKGQFQGECSAYQLLFDGSPVGCELRAHDGGVVNLQFFVSITGA